MVRRQLLTGLLMVLAMTVLVGLAYPLAITGIAQAGFHDRANGSLVKSKGKVVGSSLIGQNFADKDGNPDPRYFQPRPSAAGANGYDAMASGASNLGPSSQKLLATCLPVPAKDTKGNPQVDGKGNPVYQKNPDGSQVCDPSTVPQRAIAYRQLNGLAADAKVPVDAVTASASGLDPDISVANANLQAKRVADTRHLALSTVQSLVKAHTNGRRLGVLGEKTVNVLNLNLALDRLS